MNIQNLSTKLLATSLVLASAVAVVPKAMAQSVDMDFSATITKSCSFGAVTSGQLQESGSTLTTLTNGSVELTCNNSLASLNIAAPTQGGSNPLAASTIEYSGTVGATSVSLTGAPTPNILIGASTQTISLNLSASAFTGSPSVLPAGTYVYTIELTANPN